MQVLKGAAAILSRVDCIYIEVLEHTLRKFNSSTLDVLELLQREGFQFHYFKGDRSNVVALATHVNPRNLLRELECIPEVRA